MPYHMNFRLLLLSLCAIALQSWAQQPEAPLDDPMSEKPRKPMRLFCKEFKQGGTMPDDFLCAGDDVNPTLRVTGIPEEATFLVLLVDSKAGGVSQTHWIVYNIPIPEDRQVTVRRHTVPGIEVVNSAGKKRYAGPCAGTNRTRVEFKAYAVKAGFSLPRNATAGHLSRVMKNQVLAKARLIAYASDTAKRSY